MEELKYDPESYPMPIHTPKGILELSTKEITPLTVDKASIHCTNASYIPGDDYEPPELYLSHLRNQLTSEYEVEWLNRYALYCLSGHTHLHILTVLKGNGLNGKSTWVSTIAHIMGSYAAPTPRDIVVASNREIERAFAELDGVRFSYLSEPNKGAVLNDGILKMLASIDGLKVQARKIFKSPYDVVIQAKILIDTNNFLMTKDNTFGMWRRIHIIPWNKRVANRDTNFIGKLYAIKDSIFTYLVNQEYPNDLPPTKIMEQEASEERRFNSSVESFINECCEVVPHSEDMEVGRIYKEYRTWCEKSSEHVLPLRIFARELRHLWPDLYYSDGKKEFFRNVTVERVLQ
jgi:putative DNA primase/helicase